MELQLLLLIAICGGIAFLVFKGVTNNKRKINQDNNPSQGGGGSGGDEKLSE